MFKKCKIPIRVRAGDTDFTGFAYNVRCLEWFSIGRIELFRSFGIRYSSNGKIIIDDKPQSISFVIGEIYARFHAPAKFDELLELQTQIKEIRDKTVHFEHDIYKKSDRRLLVSGNSTYVCVDKNTVKSAKIPEGIIKLLRGHKRA